MCPSLALAMAHPAPGPARGVSSSSLQNECQKCPESADRGCSTVRGSEKVLKINRAGSDQPQSAVPQLTVSDVQRLSAEQMRFASVSVVSLEYSSKSAGR